MLTELLVFLLQIYEILILIRIMLSWINIMGIYTNVFFRFIHNITEPYMAFFRRFSFLSVGMFDFSPIVAIVILTVMKRMLVYGDYRLSVFILSLIINIWGIFRSIIYALVLFFMVRLIFLLLDLFGNTEFIKKVDSVLLPLSIKINNVLINKFMPYSTNLLVSILILFALTLIIGQIVYAVSLLAVHLPI